jgi:hypothetical protein
LSIPDLVIRRTFRYNYRVVNEKSGWLICVEKLRK